LKILQINSTLNSGSHGRIASQIGDLLIKTGNESFIAYGRTFRESTSTPIKIGNRSDFLLHIVKSRLLDRHCFSSKRATEDFIKRVKYIDWDIVHIHNIHGYYINIRILFDYLSSVGKPVIWTFHDCWSFTGHCSYFDAVNCYRWKTECFDCPNRLGYPTSWIIDNSTKNYYQKKALFTKLMSLNLVAPSQWIANHLSHSFLNKYPITIINNGIDLDRFKPVSPELARNKYNLQGKNIILGVASKWDKRKGLADFVKLRSKLASTIQIILVGLSPWQIRNLPNGILGIDRTESIEDLVELYSAADVFVNPTYIENFPTTNLEALSCGTPVITYDAGGSAETISNKCGLVVSKGNIDYLFKSVQEILAKGKTYFQKSCRSRAEEMYDKDERLMEYIKLYDSVHLKDNNKSKK
jgi:glycosyltransferase involved in cell wall biosynthesis